MNIKSVKDASFDQIKSNATLYRTIIDIMTYVDRKAPGGACCGRNKDSIINKFISDRERYINTTEMGLNRKIKPLWKGPLYFSTAGCAINADYITDEEILRLIETGKVNKKYFDMSNYVAPIEEPVNNEVEDANISIANEEEAPVPVPSKKSTRKKRKN